MTSAAGLQVWHLGVEEWLAMCIMWQHLWEAYSEWQPVWGETCRAPLPRAEAPCRPVGVALAVPVLKCHKSL